MVNTFAAVRRRQDDVLSAAQLRSYGVTRDAVRAQVDARRWQRPSRRVVVLHNGPLTWRQQCWVALLHAGNGAALCGPTAAALDGFTGYEESRVHVMAPPGARVPLLTDPPTVQHFSRHLDDTAVHPLRQPPRTRPARSLVDMSAWASDPLRACAILAAGVQQRLVLPGQLQQELERPGPMPNRRQLQLAVHDIAGGAQSLAEIDAVGLCRQAGLPPPAQQLVRLDGYGKKRYLDLPWPEYGVTAEIDGAVHLLPRNWWDDMDRQNEITLSTGRVLRFPAVVVRLYPERFLGQVERALRLGGWRG